MEKNTHTHTLTHTYTHRDIYTLVHTFKATTKITKNNSYLSLISLIFNELNFPIQKTHTNRIDEKTGFILMLHTRNTSTSKIDITLCKGLGNGFPSKWT